MFGSTLEGLKLIEGVELLLTCLIAHDLS